MEKFAGRFQACVDKVCVRTHPKCLRNRDLSVQITPSMASPRRSRARPEWSVDDASTFAAETKYKLLVLLSTNKKAEATARRLGVFAAQPQPLPAKATAGKTAAKPTRTPAADAPPAAPSTKKSQRKRSAARSARHHASRRHQLNRCMVAMLFVVRLRRRIRVTRGQAGVIDTCEESDVGEGFFPTTAMALRATSKRMSRPSSPSSSSDGDASSTSSKPEGSYAGTFTLVKHKRRGGEKKRLGCQPVLAEEPPGICYYCNMCPSLGSAPGERLCSGCHSELV